MCTDVLSDDHCLGLIELSVESHGVAEIVVDAVLVRCQRGNIAREEGHATMLLEDAIRVLDGVISEIGHDAIPLGLPCSVLVDPLVHGLGTIFTLLLRRVLLELIRLLRFIRNIRLTRVKRGDTPVPAGEPGLGAVPVAIAEANTGHDLYAGDVVLNREQIVRVLDVALSELESDDLASALLVRTVDAVVDVEAQRGGVVNGHSVDVASVSETPKDVHLGTGAALRTDRPNIDVTTPQDPQHLRTERTLLQPPPLLLAKTDDAVRDGDIGKSVSCRVEVIVLVDVLVSGVASSNVLLRGVVDRVPDEREHGSSSGVGTPHLTLLAVL